MVEEVALLSLLAALAFSYVLDRLHLLYYGRHARHIVADLQALEARLHEGDASDLEDADAMRARLSKLEKRLTAASKRLISWRSSPVERAIIGPHIDTLLFQYERAGAMTTRLTAILTRRSLGNAPQWVRPSHARGQKEASVPARP
jgi:hypothetical protein